MKVCIDYGGEPLVIGEADDPKHGRGVVGFWRRKSLPVSRGLCDFDESRTIIEAIDIRIVLALIDEEEVRVYCVEDVAHAPLLPGFVPA